MAEQTAPKLVVQDTAEPPAREPTAATPAAPPTPGLDAPMRATAESLVANNKTYILERDQRINIHDILDAEFGPRAN